MDWLKDKKNQPYIAAVLAVVILGVGVLMYFLYFKQPSVTPEPATATEPTTSTGFDTGMQDQPPSPETTNVATASPQQQPAASSNAKPMEAWRPDPFLPPNYKPPKPGKPIKVKQHIRDLPTFDLKLGAPPEPPAPPPELPQPVRRMAGLVLGDKVYAIIEQGGKNQVVQPGDMLEDRLATVFRIEKDRVILRTMDKQPKYITVRMSQGLRTETAAPPGASSPRNLPGRNYPGPGGQMGPALYEGPPPM